MEGIADKECIIALSLQNTQWIRKGVGDRLLSARAIRKRGKGGCVGEEKCHDGAMPFCLRERRRLAAIKRFLLYVTLYHAILLESNIHHISSFHHSSSMYLGKIGFGGR